MALQEHASVCTLDCPDTCSLEVTVDEGRITKVRGSKVLPLTALNDAMRAIVNEGQAVATVASEIAILAAWGLISFALSLRLFRWQ